jgi:hypothetical protein
MPNGGNLKIKAFQENSVNVTISDTGIGISDAGKIETFLAACGNQI